MKVSYPNDADRRRAKVDGRNKLGGDIMIHGSNVTVGCVPIGDDEVRRIAAFLGMSEQEFIDRETEFAPDRKTLILKSRPDESCVYLTEDNRCRIHPVKPDKCRTFPSEWTNADSADVCPALNFSAEKQR